jgi:sterol 14alpha-demethylase
VRINLILMIIWAGHETTTGHVSWALIDLLRHPRELARTADQSFEVDGFRVSEGSMILLSPAVAHRLPGPYPQPDEYRPDRFLDDPRAMRDLIGFGGGIHRCLGVHFAYLEMKVIITLLLQRYQLELVDPDPHPQPIPGQKTKWPLSPCRVRYRA